MTNEQWETLISVIDGEVIEPLPVGFIIDSPWLPGWTGNCSLDYFTNEQLWYGVNLKAVNSFGDVMFLPGFWSEFGMCTEPSAFGAKCSWQDNEHPFAHKIISDISQVDSVSKPDPSKDGLLPFVIKRLEHYRSKIEEEGHSIKFATARGPLNICTFLMGTTEFLMAIRTDPEPAGRLLKCVTDFIVDWLKLQAEKFPSIDGVLILDDIVGFLGDDDFKQSAKPYLEQIFNSLDVTVKFFHNDAAGLVCAPHLADIGVNLFNFSYEHSLERMKELTKNKVTLLGNIPPRDVLAGGTAEQVSRSVRETFGSVADKTRIIASCGGGMPPDVSTENIEAFISAIYNL